MSRKTTLAELMGRKASDRSGRLELSQLAEILGDAMPELPRNAVGRHRLVRALQQRFGPNFRSLPGIKDLVSEFDRDIDFERKVDQIRGIRYEKKKG